MRKESGRELSRCPACGSVFTGDGESADLCLACLLELAFESPSLAAELEGGDEGETLAFQQAGYAPGSVLGGRYRIRSLLGRGGMGEVWRALDLKLRVDVALKALRSELLTRSPALEALRREVRSAREVVSPNVCRVFDLVEIDGQELVSMEYIDGVQLWDILRARAPLELTEAREIAMQFLAGLEAIHAAGLVHRDIKPENIMMTRSGRVVVMDFGVAKGLAEGGTGTVSGTPAYMAPEQARGESVTSRADVFSAGVVLAEMVAPQGLKTFEDRKRLWQDLHRQPVEVPDTAWAPVLRRALAAVADERYPTASALARALEEVTVRVADAELTRPYPGLASFTEEDAEFFFGRELEVEEMWKKLQRPHLLGLIGPSGAGKSSFLRAGLLPVMPTGWRVVIATPGSQPLTSLAQALVPEFAGDTGVMRDFLRFEEKEVAVSLARRWRQQHDEVLLIIDQFEELFTQNPAEVQDRVAGLLGLLAVDADVRVLLVMRDDFLFHCSAQPALAPMFSELTPLRPPMGSALRRALVEPALKCGYRFEEESLVDEMVAEVAAERGALPLLAFAAARLWEQRDRERGLLTREAYEHIGGVGGALVKHAEATLEKIGQDQLPIVREIFRNLITSQGTRSTRDREELLSVFEGEERETADSVLAVLVDARLLTSYEERADDEKPPRKRIEIIHESLLSNWPRLVRWRTQDADSAQLRDQLRQAAQLWIERGRPEDLLWTGTSFKDFELWRERYEGGLSETEGQFASAMTQKAQQQKRRRRLAVAAVFALLLGVAAMLAIFWLRSEWARRQAVAAERQAQASNLYGLARMQPEEEPTAFLAYATASLEQADNAEVRREIVRALWKGPPGFRLPVDSRNSVDFSPDGKWLATASREVGIRLWPADGGQPLVLHGSTPSATQTTAPEATAVRFSPAGDILAHTRPTEGTTVSQSRWREVVLWSVPQAQLLRSLEFDDGDTRWFSFSSEGDWLFTLTEIEQGQIGIKEIRSWPVSGGEPSLLARLEIRDSRPFGFTVTEVDPTGARLVWTEGGRLFLAHLDASGFDLQSATELDQPGAVAGFAFNRQGNRMVTGAFEDGAVRLRLWSLKDGLPQLERALVSRGAETFPYLDATASRLFQEGAGVWDLRGPPDSAPLPLRFADRLFEGDVAFGTVAFHPNGQWIATGNTASVSFWPLERPYPHILSGHEGEVLAVRFTPDGRWLVSAGSDGTIRLWPLDPEIADRSRVLHQTEEGWGTPNRLALSPDGSFIAFSTRNGRIAILSLAGGLQRELHGFTSLITTLSVGPRGRLVAAGAGYRDKQESIVRVWDLQTDRVQILDYGNPERVFVNQTRFTPEGDLLVEAGQYLRWDLRTDPPRVVREGMTAGGLVRDFSADGRWALTTAGGFGPLAVEDLETGASRALATHAPSTNRAIFDPTGTIVISATTYPDGPISVGPVSGEEPHLLFGHESVGQEGLVGIDALAISPDGHSIASGGQDGTIRLWPMPDLAQPPLQTLPTAELVAKLQTLTNLRVVRDPDSFTGWKLEIGPFPGWNEVPEW